MDPKTCTVRPDAAIAALAARQHGVIAVRQLAPLGVSTTMLKKRIARGTLIRLHRGVYAVGHDRLRREGRWLAAVLAVGSGAALSHRDAATLHGLRPANDRQIDVTTSKIDVTTSNRGRASRPGIEVHRATLDPLDVTVVSNVPVTTVARTLVDLAGVLPKDHLAKTLNRAELSRVIEMRAIYAAMAHTRNRPNFGHAALRAALAELAEHGPTFTRSELEERFLALIRAYRLPRPKMNVHIDGFEVDACWPARRLVVELDGYAFHRDRRTFQRDREKGNALARAGWTVLRYTWLDVVHRSAETAAMLAGSLDA